MSIYELLLYPREGEDLVTFQSIYMYIYVEKYHIMVYFMINTG